MPTAIQGKTHWSDNDHVLLQAFLEKFQKHLMGQAGDEDWSVRAMVAEAKDCLTENLPEEVIVSIPSIEKV